VTNSTIQKPHETLSFKYGKCWFYKSQVRGVDLGRLKEIVLVPDLCEHLAQQFDKKDPSQTERAFRSECLSKYDSASHEDFKGVTYFHVSLSSDSSSTLNSYPPALAFTITSTAFQYSSAHLYATFQAEFH